MKRISSATTSSRVGSESSPMISRNAVAAKERCGRCIVIDFGTSTNELVEPHLTLDGLRLIWAQNRD